MAPTSTLAAAGTTGVEGEELDAVSSSLSYWLLSISSLRLGRSEYILLASLLQLHRSSCALDARFAPSRPLMIIFLMVEVHVKS